MPSCTHPSGVHVISIDPGDTSCFECGWPGPGEPPLKLVRSVQRSYSGGKVLTVPVRHIPDGAESAWDRIGRVSREGKSAAFRARVPVTASPIPPLNPDELKALEEAQKIAAKQYEANAPRGMIRADDHYEFDTSGELGIDDWPENDGPPDDFDIQKRRSGDDS